MNLWIFVITALLTPVAEPFGLSTPDVEPAGLATMPMSMGTPTTMAAPIDVEPRFHGIERMLAELDASQR